MLVIENEIAFLSIPKCASYSIHNALELYDYDIRPTFNQDYHEKLLLNRTSLNGTNNFYIKNHHKIKIHTHIPLNSIFKYVNKKCDFIIVERDYLDRFVSAFNHVINFTIPNEYHIQLKEDSIDNDFIYENFSKKTIENIITMKISSMTSNKDSDLKNSIVKPIFQKHIVNDNSKELIEKKLFDETYINFKMLDSQKYWLDGYDTNYKYDIGELYKLEEFLKNRYEKDIKFDKDNSPPKNLIKTNIVKDTKLKLWVWDNFEKHYHIKKII